MTTFYTSVNLFGNEVYVRGYHNGESIIKKEKFQPSFYVKTTKEPNSKYRTIFDEPLKKHTFESIKDAKDWLKGLHNQDIETYGNDQYAYQYLAEIYKNKEVKADFNLIKIQTLDIETTVHVTGKFPSTTNPLEEILLLTFIDFHTKKKTVFGRKSYINNNPDVIYHYFLDEKEMLLNVISYWRKSKLDIITGYNSLGFDIPYVLARVELLLGKEYVKKFSPFGQVWHRDGYDDFGNSQRTYTITGISQLDYLLLYKKFNLKKQESYKLGHIGLIELDLPKLELDCGFYESYTNHWQLYVDYNIRDTEIVDKLEEKKRYIRLAIMVAHMAKCSFEDVLGPVKLWETIIYNYLYNKDIIIPMKNDKPLKDIVGAVVKEPIPGYYRWVVSIDATSLYPSIMMMLNMSPETIIDDMFVAGSTDDFMHKKVNININHSVSCNGHVFKNNKKGVLAEVTKLYFDLRVAYKDKKKAAEQKSKDLKSQYNNIPSEALKIDCAYWKNETELNDDYQNAIKVGLINSLYGATANKFFIFYDTRISEGITKTGQVVNGHVQIELNKYLNSILGTENKDYVLMGDTDSIYFTIDPILNKFYPNAKEEELVDIVDNICKKRINPFLDKVCNEFVEYLHGEKDTLRYKQEMLASDLIVSGKKRYAAKVLDNEGVRYKEPEYKVIGFDCIKTTCPIAVKSDMKQVITNILDRHSEQDVKQFNTIVKNKYKEHKIEDISISKGVSAIDKFIDGDGFKSATPINSRAAALYNKLIKQHKLEQKYPLIKEGDKIKYVYLKTPNNIGQNVIGFIDKLPVEFGLDKYIDRETQLEKTYFSQVNHIMQSIGMNPIDKGTLDF